MSISDSLFEQAQKLIPGGVNSPVRAFRGVGGHPLFLKQGKGAYVEDVDGQTYIDYVGSWGPLILGHSHPRVVTAVRDALERGMSFGAPTELEIQLAQKIMSHLPAMDQIRMVNSGTEATMTAIRLARGFTKKNKIIKFNGCYHGHSDALLVKAGSGALTLGVPSSAGVPLSVTEHTLVADFNDLAQTARLFEMHGDDLAAVIVEPIAGNMGFVLPTDEFLPGLRALCDQYQAVLIFDEVMTGFRVALGGAQALYSVRPDLTTLGKIIGGGLPVGALGGRLEIMSCLAPEGDVYQAGTLSGNPLAMAAGLATLTELEAPGVYETLGANTQYLMSGLVDVAHSCNIPLQASAVGGLFGFCFTDQASIRCYADVAKADEKQFISFYHGMLKQGIYFAPSRFEAGFVSTAHTRDDFDRTHAAAAEVLGFN